MIIVSPSQNWAPPAATWLHDADALDAIVRAPARLAAVRASGLGAAQAEAAFDALTRLATQLLDATASFLAVVEASEDQYASHCGFGPPLSLEARWKGRTFCHFTLALGDTLVIEDTAAHMPWCDVPTVQALGVRAYAGVPLRLNGQLIGSFCVIDQRPRAWTTLQIDILQQLAASAEREISLRSALGRERQQTARAQRRARERAQALVLLAQEVQAPLQALQLCCLQLRRQAADLPPESAWASLAQRVTEATRLMRDGLNRNLRPVGRRPDPGLQTMVPLDELAHTVAGLVQPLAATRGVGLALHLHSQGEAQLDYAQALRLVLHITLHALELAREGQQVLISTTGADEQTDTGCQPTWRWTISTGAAVIPGADDSSVAWEALPSDRQDMLDHARLQGLALTLSDSSQPFQAVLHWGTAPGQA